MKVSRGRQAELSLDLAGQQGQGSCVQGPAPARALSFTQRDHIPWPKIEEHSLPSSSGKPGPCGHLHTQNPHQQN